MRTSRLGSRLFSILDCVNRTSAVCVPSTNTFSSIPFSGVSPELTGASLVEPLHPTTLT
nr:MAG TPA: hypothetical protein [Caudoviricetes sp.]